MKACLLVLLLAATSFVHAANPIHSLSLGKPGKELVSDDFSKSGKPGRRPTRGEWKSADSTISCTQDDALYKKYQNHGPALWFDFDYHDAVIEFEVKQENCKSFVFTVNGKDGHVFRFVTSAKQTSVRAWPADDPNHKSIASTTGKVTIKDLADWTKVTIELKDAKSSIQIGSGKKMTAEHPTYTTPKTIVGLGFSFGRASFRNFRVRELN